MNEDNTSGWGSQKDIIKDELSAALRELSKAETGLGWNETSIKRAIVEIVFVRNRVLDVLEEKKFFKSLRKLKRKCKDEDIDLIMRAAYLADENSNIWLSSYIVQRYRGITLGLLNYLESGANQLSEDQKLPKDIKNIYTDIGFVSYEHSKVLANDVLKILKNLDKAFRWDKHSLPQRKIYAFDFIFSLEKLRTIFAHICTREEIESHDLRIFEIFKSAFLWWIDDVGELVTDLLEYWKSEDMFMMVAILMDMSQKIVNYCDNLDASMLEGPFIWIENTSELENDFND